MSQTTTLTIPPSFQCVSGTVNLFRFIQAPPPGSVIGQITLLSGRTIPLIQTQPTPLGGTSLASVDGRFATLCGVFVVRQGQTVLDVRIVNPGAPSPTGTPVPSVNQLLLLLIILLLLGGGGLNLGGLNLSGLNLSSLNLSGLNPATIQAQLSAMGITTSQEQILGALRTLGVTV